jgi:hypothetical protein
LDAGLRLGEMFRTHHFKTGIGWTIPDDYGYEGAVGGQCYSACAYAFLGGVHRSVDGHASATRFQMVHSRLGFHQFHQESSRPNGVPAPAIPAGAPALAEPPGSAAAALSTGQVTAGVIAAYLVEMGIDARVLTLGSLASPDEIYEPTPAERIALRIEIAPAADIWRLESFYGDLAAVVYRTDTAGGSSKSVGFYCDTQLRAPVVVVQVPTLHGKTDAEFHAGIIGASTVAIGPQTYAIDPRSMIFASRDSGDDLFIPLPGRLPALSNVDRIDITVPMSHADSYGVYSSTTFTAAAPQDLVMAMRDCR